MCTSKNLGVFGQCLAFLAASCQIVCYEAVPGHMGQRGMNEHPGHEAI